MKTEYLNSMLDIIREAGSLALSMMGTSQPRMKKDGSVISDTDISISNLVRTRLASFLKEDDHILIDEEDPDSARYLSETIIQSKKYIWCLDPIDGTRIYVNQMPHYGISLGLIKDGQPWLGVVLFPSLNELFYCDGMTSYFIKNAFSKKEMKKEINKSNQVISNASIFLTREDFLNLHPSAEKYIHSSILSCAVADLCWPTIGRGFASVFKSSLWDFAGSWPIFQSAGLFLWNTSTDQVMDQLDVTCFNRSDKPWELNDFYVLCSAKHYPELKAMFKAARV